MLSRLMAIWMAMVSVTAFANSNVAVQQTGEDFSRYRERLFEHFLANKAWVNEANKQQEVLAVLPFEHRPDPEACEGSSEVGLLLFHGLSDSPFVLRDPAKALSNYCVHTRVMLLPGHGTQAKALLTVERDDWRDAVSQAVESFSKEVDTLYIGGFSTGGALVTEYAWQHPESVAGVVLFAPLFKINSGIDWLAPWLSPFIDWLDHHEPDDYAKYASIPVPAISQAYHLAKEVRQTVAQQPAVVPVLLALSEQDATVDSDVSLSVYQQSMAQHPNSHLVLYSTTRSSEQGPQRQVINAVLPEQRIHGLSHMAVHGSPDNPYYGESGSFRICGWYYGEQALYDACRSQEQQWFGERSDALTERSESAARLSWNPYFDELMRQVAVFMGVAEEP